MRFLSLATGLVGAATLAAALQSPHKRVPAPVRREAVLTRDAPRKSKASRYLNSKTESKHLNTFPRPAIYGKASP